MAIVIKKPEEKILERGPVPVGIGELRGPVTALLGEHLLACGSGIGSGSSWPQKPGFVNTPQANVFFIALIF